MKSKLTISITLLLMSVFIVKAQWTELTSGTTMDLNSVFFTDPSTGYVVGGKFDLVWQGSVGKTTDGGNTWTHAIQGTNILNSVHFPDANTGYIVGNGGVILKTLNAGASWVPQASGVTKSLKSVHFVDANVGHAVGWDGVILKTTDGGANWIAQYIGFSIFNSVFFVDTNIGYVVGTDGILKTTDGGTSWFAQTSGVTTGFSSVCFIDANIGYVSGVSGVVLKTTDGGTNWVAQSSGYPSANLCSVNFVDANIGYISGYMYLPFHSIILKTIDGGANWTTQASPVNEKLNSIHFPVSTVGYIVGNEGKILREGDPAASVSAVSSENQLMIYPNPVSDVLHIHTQNNNSFVEIYNPMGQLIHTSAFNDNTQISTHGFAAGVYIVKVSSGTDVRYEKIIVK